jgi:hypothetical protein
MDAAHSSGVGYSAEVQMELYLNGFVLSIGQLGPGFILVDDAPDHPPANAEIALSIDGDESRWTVHLPDGLVAGRRRTRICKV